MLIERFSDGSFLEFDRGHFDSWCVYLTEGNSRHAPRDTAYFQTLLNLAQRYGPDKVYQDFVTIYNETTKEVSSNTLNNIKTIAATYGENSLTAHKTFTILYATMIAENNKRNTVLGKKIKRLGVHYLLLEGKPAAQAANCMRGCSAASIDAECAARGF